MYRFRKEAESNYSAVFIDGKTIRVPVNASRLITEIHFPEFFDISPGTKCSGGCDYCYAGALKNGVHYRNLGKKVHEPSLGK
jgi:DNA repair photolyase